MDLVEVLSNLHALRQLYGLLQNSEDGPQHIDSRNVGQALDARARQLLKDLLDDATERIFNTHSRVFIEPLIIADQSAVYNTPFSSQPELPKGVPKFNSSFSQDTVKSSLNTVPNYAKDSKSCKVTSKKDEQSPKKPQGAISGSKVSISSDLPEYKKKQCRICIENNLKQQYSVGETKISSERAKVPSKRSKNQDHQHDWLSPLNCVDEDAKVLQESNRKVLGKENIIGETLGNPSIVSLAACPSISPTTGTGKQEIGQDKRKADEASYFAKVVANAIKQIESHILALQLRSSHLADSVHNDVDEHGSFKLDSSVSPIPMVQIKEEAVTRRELSHVGQSLLAGTQLLTCQASRLSQKHESPSGKVAEFASRGHDSPSQDNQMASYVNGLRVPPSQNEVAMNPPMHVIKMPGQTWQTSPVQNLTAKKETVRSRPSIPPQPTGSIASSVALRPGKKLSQTGKRKSSPRHHQTIMRPVLLDHKPSERMGTHKMSYVGPRNKIIPHQQALQETSSSSHTWSTWTSKQNESSAGSNDSEDYWSSSSPRRSHHMTVRGNLSSSRRSIRVAQESSSPNSSSEESLYSHQKYLDRPIGRLRRLKNRLGLIFHHHHHHHHHHDGNDHDNNHSHSTWKHLQKMFDGHKNKHGSYMQQQQQGEGVRKSVVKVKGLSHNKQQVGHFHALVEGLLRLTRHSNKSNNLSKGKGGLRNGPHGHVLNKQKVVKKMHWWQMFRHGGVKLPKRGRVKVGFTSKRPKLKMK